MKTKFILLCAATAVLAACAKTEVTPEILNQDAEITFLTAPVTKAASENEKTFANTNVFQTAAFYDTAENGFVYKSGTAETYIEKSTVKNFSGLWKVADPTDETKAKSYYWPKDGGKLSFFSWSLNTGSLTFTQGTPTVDINVNDGVKLTGYSSLKNDDFMVADPALDMTQNTNPGKFYTEGVPTLFHHKTCQFVVNAKTKADYTVDPYKQVFTIDEINFIELGTEGSYAQITDKWTLETIADGYSVPFYAKGETTGHVVNYNNGVAEEVESTGTKLYLPQDVAAGQKLQVVYTVSRTSAKNTKSTQYTAEIAMSDLGFTTFAAGKKYTITLSISSGNEILWTPEVVDWVDEAKTISVTES